MSQLPASSIVIEERPGKGRCVFSATDLPAGTEVWTEIPLASMQHLHNQALVRGCARCLRPLCDVATETFPCGGGCGIPYCSFECATAAWQQGHALLCVGRLNEADADTHPLMLFKQHALHTNEILLLAGECVARVANDIAAHGVPVEAALAPFQSCHARQWWEVPQQLEPTEEAQVRTEMHDMLIESHAHLMGALESSVGTALPPPLYDPAFMSHILGAFELNNIGIEIPVVNVDPSLARSSAAAGASSAQNQQEEEEEDEEADGSAVLGTALFSIASRMNHSCQPNVVVEYNQGTHCASIVALSDIPMGTELCISYLGSDIENDDYETRTQMLADYAFACDCARCVARL